jgi:hypothetical protein
MAVAFGMMALFAFLGTSLGQQGKVCKVGFDDYSGTCQAGKDTNGKCVDCKMGTCRVNGCDSGSSTCGYNSISLCNGTSYQFQSKCMIPLKGGCTTAFVACP